MGRAITLFVAAFTPSCSCGSVAATPDGAVDVAASDVASEAPSDAVVAEASVQPCNVAMANGDVIGCDYVAIHPSTMNMLGTITGCLAAVVVNPNDAPLDLAVTFEGANKLPFHAATLSGQGRSASYAALSGNEVAAHGAVVIALAQGASDYQTTCHIPGATVIVDESKAIEIDALPNRTASAFHIQTTLPAPVYEIWQYAPDGASSGVVVPLRATASWGSSYVDVGTYLPGCDAGGCNLATGCAWTAAVSAQNVGTSISMPSAQNGTIAQVLGSYELLSVARCNEFIGQTTTANQAYSLWVGTAALQVPGGYDCIPTYNSPALQVPNVNDWGHTYVFARQDNRLASTSERSLIRIVAAADSTTLTYSPAMPSGAPTSLAKGEVGVFWAEAPFVVASQDAVHPIFVVAHMVDSRDFDPGCEDADAATQSTEGSSAMHAVPAVERWGQRYDFFTPFNYPSAELVIVRAIGGADVTLDCAGVVTAWQPIDGSYELARLWLSKDDGGAFNPQVYAGGTCDNGLRTITSADRFGVTAYGWITAPSDAFGDAGTHGATGSSYAYAPLAAHATIGSSDGGSH